LGSFLPRPCGSSDGLFHDALRIVYRQIEYQVRAGLGQNEWVSHLLSRQGLTDAAVSKFKGTKEEAGGTPVSRLIIG
jgi:hypothetical protein